jgi:hypothetical protein
VAFISGVISGDPISPAPHALSAPARSRAPRRVGHSAAAPSPRAAVARTAAAAPRRSSRRSSGALRETPRAPRDAPPAKLGRSPMRGNQWRQSALRDAPPAKLGRSPMRGNQWRQSGEAIIRGIQWRQSEAISEIAPALAAGAPPLTHPDEIARAAPPPSCAPPPPHSAATVNVNEIRSRSHSGRHQRQSRGH